MHCQLMCTQCGKRYSLEENMQGQLMCTQCGKRYPLNESKVRCDACRELLEVFYEVLRSEREGHGHILR